MQAAVGASPPPPPPPALVAEGPRQAESDGANMEQMWVAMQESAASMQRLLSEIPGSTASGQLAATVATGPSVVVAPAAATTLQQATTPMQPPQLPMPMPTASCMPMALTGATAMAIRQVPQMIIPQQLNMGMMFPPGLMQQPLVMAQHTSTAAPHPGTMPMLVPQVPFSAIPQQDYTPQEVLLGQPVSGTQSLLVPPPPAPSLQSLPGQPSQSSLAEELAKALGVPVHAAVQASQSECPEASAESTELVSCSGDPNSANSTNTACGSSDGANLTPEVASVDVKAIRVLHHTSQNSEGAGLQDTVSKMRHQSANSRSKKNKQMRRIEEIWGMDPEDYKDASKATVGSEKLPMRSGATKRRGREQKRTIENIWGSNSQNEVNRIAQSAEVSAQSQIAKALLAFSDVETTSEAGPNEALEKAKVALAAIETRTQKQAQEVAASATRMVAASSGDSAAGGVFASDQQYASWANSAIQQNGVGFEQAAAIQSAVAAAHQAQFVQQYQFQHQNKQHEHQHNKATGSAVSRFQDGYMPLFLCKKLVTMGSCPRGDSCTFAHNVEELHPASPDLPKSEELTGTGVLAEQVQEVDQMPDVKMKRKRSMCQRYQKGECLLGKQCPFAHKEEDLGTVELVLCGNVKTRICKMWKVGKCIYTANCWDAHGDKEIGLKRPPPELCPKIKRVRKDVNDALQPEPSRQQPG